MKMRSVLAALLALVMLLGVVGVAAADEKTTVASGKPSPMLSTSIW